MPILARNTNGIRYESMESDSTNAQSATASATYTGASFADRSSVSTRIAVMPASQVFGDVDVAVSFCVSVTSTLFCASVLFALSAAFFEAVDASSLF